MRHWRRAPDRARGTGVPARPRQPGSRDSQNSPRKKFPRSFARFKRLGARELPPRLLLYSNRAAKHTKACAATLAGPEEMIGRTEETKPSVCNSAQAVALPRNRSSRLETFPAQHRTPLLGHKGNRGFPATSRACNPGFNSRQNRPGRRRHLRDLLSFTLPAAFRFVDKTLFPEECLFPGCENELLPALHTLQPLVLKFH